MATTFGIFVSTASPSGNAPTEVPPAPFAEARLSAQFNSLFRIGLLSPQPGTVGHIISCLRELQDGWSGAGSVAPGPKVIKDIQTALSGVLLRDHELEVDIDGSVALLWETAETTFALTFVGNGQVVGSVFPQSATEPPWALPVDAGLDIAARLADRGAATIPS